MTPQERDLITHLLQRLKEAGGQPKDPEADAMIRQAVAAQPDAPYYLVQTVLIQDMTLSNAQSRIADLERQLAEARDSAQPAQPTSFLGGLFGRSAPPPAAGAPGPWTRPAPAQGAPAQAAPPYQPAYPPQAYQAAPMMPMAQGGSGFLRQAAATAAGVAGGALLFEGIQSMFGPHAGGILSNASMQPGISETVVNNYYGSDPAPDLSPRDAAWDDSRGGAEPADYTQSDSDSGSDQDFSSDDFGGGGGDDYA
jgi:hypothetical protein